VKAFYSPPALASLFCFAFGTFLILNVQMASDGWWFWYAKLFRAGHSLYGDLHFNLQPLFVLETALFQTAFGESWLASKIPGVLHLALFVSGFHAIVAQIPDFTPREKSIVLIASFFVAINFEAYRFDDYHVLAHVFYLFSVVLLLNLADPEATDRRQGFLALGLGCLSGLTLLTRVNDGAMLVFCNAAVMLIGTNGHRRQFLLLARYLASAAATVSILLVITGDSPGVYVHQSLLEAAAIKGGHSNLLVRPLLLIQNSVQTLLMLNNWQLIGLSIALTWSLRELLSEVASANDSSGWRRVLHLSIFILAVTSLMTTLDDRRFVRIFNAATILIVCARVLLILELIGGKQAAPSQTAARLSPSLVLLPFGYYVAASLSSAGSIDSLTFPFAMSIAVLLLSAELSSRQKFLTVALIGLLGVGASLQKTIYPASWHGFRSPPLLVDRQVIEHPIHGPMVIEDSLRLFAEDVCTTIGTKDTTLLSVPFPYINYYCGIAPWKGYVQTFFDTSSRRSIEALTAQVASSPPDFILFQEQEINLRDHEGLYNEGNKLPHRMLNEFFMHQIEIGAWIILRQREYANTNWYLISTRRPGKQPT
jgi:hypothetical protein